MHVVCDMFKRYTCAISGNDFRDCRIFENMGGWKLCDIMMHCFWRLCDVIMYHI